MGVCMRGMWMCGRVGGRCDEVGSSEEKGYGDMTTEYFTGAP